MITYTKGNLLQADVEALVNAVNTVGIMGKGIALQFKETLPENYQHYKKAAEAKQLHNGKMFTVAINKICGIKWIINFPTKKHWRYPSKLEYIKEGLDDLLEVIKDKKISSVALPPLGCGNGGLDWQTVKSVMEQNLAMLPDVHFIVYEPSEIAYEPQTNPKKKKPDLTPTRAMILYLMKNYAQLEYSLTVLETQKLVYFLGRLGDSDIGKIQFKKYLYGPYAAVLNSVLYDMDGVYLEGMKYKDVKTFDPLNVKEANYNNVEEFMTIHATNQQQDRIHKLLQMIEGFETPLSMELLATVDYVMKNEVDNFSDLEAVIQKVHSWNPRKQQIMPAAYIQIAHNRLMQFASELYA